MEHSRRKKGLRIALAVLVVLLIGAASYWYATRPLSVQAATVVRGTVQETLALDGDVVLDRQSLVVSTLNGRVRDLAIEEGDDVEKGQLLAVLDTAAVFDAAGVERTVAIFREAGLRPGPSNSP
uniref:biotin/lipoyl-binding protein n=1 Tax=Marivita sp. TaxID=2003365 RepID=UPI0025BB7067